MLRVLTRIAAVFVLAAGCFGLAYAAGTFRGAPSEAAAPLPSVTPSASPTPLATPTPSPTHTPIPSTTPRPIAGPRLLGAGDSGAKVKDLQARLRQIGWFSGNVTGSYGSITTTAVRGFQAKRKIPVTGYVDRLTLARLTAMTHQPTTDELNNVITSQTSTSARLDARCTTGRALCIDKSSRTLRWVVDGKVKATYSVRFGASYTPTREGQFRVEWKSANHVSRLYGSAMPFAMFFSRGQAVHYSSDFAARGYNGASHGCVNVRDYNGIKWLFSQVAIGDKVVVYWS